MADSSYNMSDIRIHPPVWALIVAVAVGGGFYLAGKNIDAKHHNDQPSTITVSGDGKAFAIPDIAEINVGMDTGRQATASAAMTKLKTAMDAVIASVKAQGVDAKDIMTQNFSLNPVYDYTNGQQVARGFDATESLMVKVRNLDKSSDVLGAATAAGANQAGGVQFTVDKPDAVQAQARAEAIKKAQDKAQVLAQQLGVHLGRIINFSEGNGGGYPVPMMYNKAMDVGAGSAMDAQAVQLPVGQQEVDSTVSITYELN